MTSPQPTLTDGVVTLRPSRDEDVSSAIAGHDEEIARRLGRTEDASTVNFLVEADGAVAGLVEVRTDDGVGDLSWVLYAGHRGRGYAARAVRLLVGYAFESLGLRRVEAHVNSANERSKRVASRSGLRREGVLRGREVLLGETHDTVLFARLATDPAPDRPESFRAMLNANLPRKRAIAQMLVRDDTGRVLLCRLTYKNDWDLPGGVVEVGESPQVAVTRELEEELALTVEAGPLLLTDWLPPWSGWDDALCLVFDGGLLDPSVLDDAVLEPREIASVQFCTLDEVREHCADFTARRIESALRTLDGGGPKYTESGRA
ncbi:hypothetical protein BH10ACT10_BH10ACT10_08610 [soil metagenome]